MIDTCDVVRTAARDDTASAASDETSAFQKAVHANLVRVWNAPLDRQEEITLMTSARAGLNRAPGEALEDAERDAIARLTDHHMGWIVRLVRDIADQHGAHHMVDDMTSAGIDAFLGAMRRHDPDGGARLATFSAYAITGAALQFIHDQAGPARIGTNSAQRKLLARRREMLAALEDHLGRTPDLECAQDREALSRLTGITPSAALVIHRHAGKPSVSVDLYDILDAGPSAETKTIQAEGAQKLQQAAREALAEAPYETRYIFAAFAAADEWTGLADRLAKRFSLTRRQVNRRRQAAARKVAKHLSHLDA